MSWFGPYTVSLPPKCEPQNLTAGPYSDSEVIEQKRDIAGYAYVSKCFVSEQSTHPLAAQEPKQ